MILTNWKKEIKFTNSIIARYGGLFDGCSKTLIVIATEHNDMHHVARIGIVNTGILRHDNRLRFTEF